MRPARTGFAGLSCRTIDMAIAYLALSSSVGDRIDKIRKALELLNQDGRIQVRATSAYYESEPQEYPNQNWFVNVVAELETDLPPRDLLTALQQVEHELQEEAQTIRWGPRSLDADLLLYGREVIAEPGLQVPHIRMHDRACVLIPLSEVAPTLVHPTLDKTPKELYEMLTRPTQVRRLDIETVTATC